ncbi:MAG TPA: cytochrome C oxidase subunit IV family protein [Terriglobales bacterium]|nr:cytochrome C oxidase subunit IV family protein [Terriglobales bacterium]
MSEHVIAWKTYLWVWLALMALMAITAFLSTVDLGQWNTPVALAIGVVKALLVVFFFMHVRYESQKMIWAVVVAGVVWLFIMMGLTMTDMLTRTWTGVPGH